MVFIPDTVSKSGVTPESSYIVGETFGDFQAMLADIPEKLGETIKDFHNIEFRLQQFHEAVKEDKMGRAAGVKDIIDEIEKRAETMTKSEKLFREGKLPKRICHCDTKVDNILFDKDDSVLCVIDLDTVMPSFIFSDFGDFLRSAANTQAEDSPEYDKIEFRMDIFKAFTEGYLKTASAFLTPIEIETFPTAQRSSLTCSSCASSPTTSMVIPTTRFSIPSTTSYVLRTSSPSFSVLKRRFQKWKPSSRSSSRSK